MNSFSPGDVAGMIAWATPTVAAILQWVKQSPLVRNGWLPGLAPAVGIVVLVGWVATAGGIAVVDGTLSVQAATVYQAVLGGIGAGVAAVSAYQGQKALGLGILAAGPDNHPSDQARVPALPVIPPAVSPDDAPGSPPDASPGDQTL